MRKFLLIALVTFFTLTASGCLTMQIKGDEQLNPIVEITARRVANGIAKNSPDKVNYIIKECDKILSVDIEDGIPLMTTAIKYAVDKYTNDPLLFKDIMSLAKFYGVDLKDPEIDLDLGDVRSLRNALEEFRFALAASK